MIGALILGIVAGFLGRALLPGKQEMGFLITIVLGLAGSAVGFLIFTELLGIGDTEAFDLGGLPGAVIGAMILLFAYDRFIASRSTPAAPATPAKSGAAAKEGGAAPTGASEERRRDREREERRQRREKRDG